MVESLHLVHLKFPLRENIMVKTKADAMIWLDQLTLLNI